MARTPKIVRRNGGNCVCPDSAASIKWKVYDEGTCKYGYCFSAKCQKCRGELWGMGPLACYCDGAPRWVRHKAMARLGRWDLEKDAFAEGHVAIKPSIARRRHV